MRFVVVLLAVSILFSCSDKEKVAQLEEKNAQLEAEYALLVKEGALKNDFIEEYTRTINDVYENLEKIREREGYIAKVSRGVEKNESVPIKDAMLSNISSIDAYLQKSKKQLRELKKKMEASHLQTVELEKTVENLGRLLEEKEHHIAELKAQTEVLSLKVAEVEGQLHEKEALLERQSQAINTVFYIVGTEEELKEKGIIEEKGGFLGMGKTKKLAAAFKYDYFTRTDISDAGKIPIYRGINKVNIISPHNPESYQIVERAEEQTVLEILDPQEFWKLKYLVILYKS